ncbi:alanine dehydrogenase [Psychromonas ossibalaenae]|uniref:alanine dehydrogenase n=1 Tax=Psychromonas ossibalaenae TaxID=444922 RepID=UPI0003697276|nr:alanine dehydrogenase [Psychromonas ossibalaenae]
MIIGIPKEIKNNEYRVGLIPSSVAELSAHGHQIIVERNAGAEIGFADQDYINAGAEIAVDARTVFSQAEMIVKVKEPQQNECSMLHPQQILFTYLHLAPDLKQTQALIKSGAVCIAYETVTDNNGQLPLLRPMSEVAGRMSIQAGAAALQKSNGGSGLLLAGVPGVAPANVVILGGGIVGCNAAKMALGLGAEVVILDKNINTLRRIDNQFSGRINTVYSTRESLENHVVNADLVIGAVLIPGAAAPKLVSRELIKQMKKGSAVVDVAIDQGGCFATSRATTHQNPTYVVDGIVHYCVANMPGDVALTATQALNNVTLPYVLKLADLGYRQALKEDKHLLNGLNICAGKVTLKEVAKAHALEFSDPQLLI